MIYSDNSRRSYASDWRDFCRWLTSYYGEAYPLESTPIDIVDYIRALTRRGLKPLTVERHLTAITYFFTAAGLDSPAAAAWPRQVLKAAKAKGGTLTHKKQPLLYEDVAIICAAIPDDDPAAARDRAIIALGWALAARRSELAALRVEDVTFTRDGCEVLLRRSKADRFGAGALLAVPRLSPLDPCSVLADWLLRSRLTRGLLFGGLHPRTISDIIKRRARAAGYRGDIAAHSLRRGYTTDIARAGHSLADLMAATRHKSTRVLVDYIEPLRRYKLKP